MTKKQRIALWHKISQCFDRHEREMMEQQKKEHKFGPCQGHAFVEQDEGERRMDIIGQNGNDGDHYAKEFVRHQQAAEPWLFRYESTAELKDSVKQYSDPLDPTFSEEPNGRWNWYGEAEEEDATSMDDDLPSAAEDCAKQRGSYEI